MYIRNSLDTPPHIHIMHLHRLVGTANEDQVCIIIAKIDRVSPAPQLAPPLPPTGVEVIDGREGSDGLGGV